MIFANDVFDDARHIAPLRKRVESAADEYESLVFDELIVTGGHMSAFLENFLNVFRYLGKVNRRSVLSDDEECIIAHAPWYECSGWRFSCSHSPSAFLPMRFERLSQRLMTSFVLVLFRNTLEVFEKILHHFRFGKKVCGRDALVKLFERFFHLLRKSRIDLPASV